MQIQSYRYLLVLLISGLLTSQLGIDPVVKSIIHVQEWRRGGHLLYIEWLHLSTNSNTSVYLHIYISTYLHISTHHRGAAVDSDTVMPVSVAGGGSVALAGLVWLMRLSAQLPILARVNTNYSTLSRLSTYISATNLLPELDCVGLVALIRLLVAHIEPADLPVAVVHHRGVVLYQHALLCV